jgi:hypothetical protein
MTPRRRAELVLLELELRAALVELQRRLRLAGAELDRWYVDLEAGR